MARSEIGIRPQGASRYPDEKVINFYSPNGGGLISFRMLGNGTLRVDVYRTDPTVVVSLGAEVQSVQARDIAAALAEVDRQRKPASGPGGGYVVALEALATTVRAEQPVSS